MIQATLLANPVAGQRRWTVEDEQRLLARLSGIGFDCELIHTLPGPQPIPRLDLSRKELLIIRGGDGTLHRALEQAIEWRRPVAILPTGTANVLARELGIPHNLDGALRTMSQGVPRRIHLGVANGKYFQLMAGVGLDGHVIHQLRPGLKKSLGTLSYWYSGFRSFWTFPLPDLQVTADGEKLGATFAVISNGRRYGNCLLMAPQASLFEDRLDVCLFNSRHRSRFLGYLWQALNGSHIRSRDVVYRKARRISIRCESEVPIQMDGEAEGGLPLECRVADECLEVLTPRTPADGIPIQTSAEVHGPAVL